jgi:hypothetical protein
LERISSDAIFAIKPSDGRNVDWAVLQALFWHITNVAPSFFVTGLHPLAFVPGARVHVPATSPLLKVPVVLVVPFDVPVKPSGLLVSVSTLPLVEEVMVRLRVPVT